MSPTTPKNAGAAANFKAASNGKHSPKNGKGNPKGKEDGKVNTEPAAHGKNQVVKSPNGNAQKKNELTPAQFLKLKSGPKVNIYIGPADNQFIGVEGAYANVLKHYSTLAQRTLSKVGVSTIHIPGGTKGCMKWIYAYMLAGEIDPAGDIPFNALDMDRLVKLYTHAAAMEYDTLKDRVYHRLAFLVQEEEIDAEAIQKVLQLAPTLAGHVAKAAAKQIVEPNCKSYEAIQKCMTTVPGLGELIETEVAYLLKMLIDRGHRFYSQPGPAKYNAWLFKNYYYRERHVRPAKVVEQKKAITCNYCGEVGHIARGCAKRAEDNKCYKCHRPGHLARECKVGRSDGDSKGDSKGSSRGNTNGNCKDNSKGARTGRTRVARRAQAERKNYQPIELGGNGESLTTCDHECRPGQITRTGLMI